MPQLFILKTSCPQQFQTLLANCGIEHQIIAQGIISTTDNHHLEDNYVYQTELSDWDAVSDADDWDN